MQQYSNTRLKYRTRPSPTLLKDHTTLPSEKIKKNTLTFFWPPSPNNFCTAPYWELKNKTKKHLNFFFIYDKSDFHFTEPKILIYGKLPFFGGNLCSSSV